MFIHLFIPTPPFPHRRMDKHSGLTITGLFVVTSTHNFSTMGGFSSKPSLCDLAGLFSDGRYQQFLKGLAARRRVGRGRKDRWKAPGLDLSEVASQASGTFSFAALLSTASDFG
jgi:hypothetical protein